MDYPSPEEFPCYYYLTDINLTVRTVNNRQKPSDYFGGVLNPMINIGFQKGR